jgi:FMN phosphatase YigB (HAD superfamily)
MNDSKIKAILFDLDNTLILFDEKKFYELYVYRLSLHFSDIMDTKEFAEKLMKSTVIMSKNNGRQNNAKYFIADFSKGLNIDAQLLWKRFETFYSKEFVNFEKIMKPVAKAAEVIKKIKEMNLKMVIASNPMLPDTVQKLRLEWAGLKNIKFDLITDAYNSYFCKPNLKYYKEICEKLSIAPSQCLMVGNDAYNDMIASEIGMKTFLVTNADNNSVEVSREIAGLNHVELPEPDYKGELKDLISVINSLNN